MNLPTGVKRFGPGVYKCTDAQQRVWVITKTEQGGWMAVRGEQTLLGRTIAVVAGLCDEYHDPKPGGVLKARSHRDVGVSAGARKMSRSSRRANLRHGKRA